MRNTVPAKAPPNPSVVAEQLAALGTRIRARRKALRVSATALAEAAGMSRVSVHRIEQGEPSVTMGAYLNVLAALGMTFSAAVVADEASEMAADDKAGWLPARVRLADYPALKQLAWQVQGVDELTPREALGIYERNWRHLDEAAPTIPGQSADDAGAQTSPAPGVSAPPKASRTTENLHPLPWCGATAPGGSSRKTSAPSGWRRASTRPPRRALLTREGMCRSNA